jgi:hypothetical protein
MRIVGSCLIVASLLIIGCSGNTVEFKKKTVVTFEDQILGRQVKAEITCDSLAGGITMEMKNIGEDEISLEGRDAFYEDKSGSVIHAVNDFMTTSQYGRGFYSSTSFRILSGKMNVAGMRPPAEARTVVFKDSDHKNVLFRVALK